MFLLNTSLALYEMAVDENLNAFNMNSEKENFHKMSISSSFIVFCVCLFLSRPYNNIGFFFIMTKAHIVKSTLRLSWVQCQPYKQVHKQLISVSKHVVLEYVYRWLILLQQEKEYNGYKDTTWISYLVQTTLFWNSIH